MYLCDLSPCAKAGSGPTNLVLLVHVPRCPETHVRQILLSIDRLLANLGHSMISFDMKRYEAEASKDAWLSVQMCVVLSVISFSSELQCILL